MNTTPDQGTDREVEAAKPCAPSAAAETPPQDMQYRTYSVYAVANYILSQLHARSVTDATNMKMQKLVYFAQGFMFGLKKHPLMDEYFEAWTYGPVCVKLYERLKRYGTERITVSELRSPDRIEEGSEAAEVINRMLDMLGHYKAAQLVTLSHDPEGPWKATWERERKYAVIPNWRVMDYFTRVLA